MVDLTHFESVFSTGFAIHFAYTLLQEYRARTDSNQTMLIQSLDDRTGSHISEWAAFRSHVSAASENIRRLTRKTSIASILVAAYNVGALVYIAFRQGAVLDVRSGIAAFLVILALVPLPFFFFLIYLRSRQHKRFIMAEYHLFIEVCKKFNYDPSTRPTGSHQDSLKHLMEINEQLRRQKDQALHKKDPN